MARMEMEPVPPCRVLMRDGVACDEVITERPAPCPMRPVYVARDVAVPRPRTGRRGVVGLKRLYGITAAVVRELRKDGLSQMEIARRLGCSLATVRNRLQE